MRQDRMDGAPMSDVDLIARVRVLEEALKLAQKSEDDHHNCDECNGDIEAELCEVCFPAADKARLARWDALGINQPINNVVAFKAAPLPPPPKDTET
jgi:hypothetical protein